MTFRTGSRPAVRRPLGDLLLAALLALLGAPLRADGLIYVENPPEVTVVPVPVPVPHTRIRHFPLRVTRHRVAVQADDTLVRTRVEESFYNPAGVELEGRYIFPVPGGAAVSGFRMEAGGKELTGEVLEKERARELYEAIVRQARDPGLLEYVGRELFQVRVFPIPPRAALDVTIEYSQALRRDHGVTLYRYPLDTGRFSAGVYENVVIDVELRSTLPLRSIHCPSHPVAVSRRGEREARVTFEASRLRADRDFLLVWNVSDDALAPALLTHRGTEEEGFFFLAVAPRPMSDQAPPPKDVVFAIDISGSMLGRKIQQVKRALAYGLEGLNGGDRFNIVDFSTEARRFREALVEATEAARAEAAAYIGKLEARGGTNIEEALRFALEGAPVGERLQVVVLLTDGEPTVGVTRTPEIVESLRRHNPAGKRLFIFGVGEDLNAQLLDLLVKEGRGAAEYIRSDQDLEVPLSSFFDKIDAPVLTGVTITFTGGGMGDVYPRPLPDLFKGEELELFGRYGSDGPTTLVVKGRFWGKPHVFEYPLELKRATNGYIAHLWATAKIGYLLEQMRLGGETKEVREEVIRLSKRYGVLTPYTSYLILEDQGPPPVATRGGERWLFYHAARRALAPTGAGGAGEGGEALPQVRLEVAAGADDFEKAKGAPAISGSRTLRALKEARPDVARQFLADAVNVRTVRVKSAGSRTFYLQEERWVDSALAALAEEPPPERTVKYLSEEYFGLLREHPELGPFLAVGPRVSFLWEGRVLSVVE